MSAVRIIAKAVLKLKRCDRKQWVALAGSDRLYQCHLDQEFFKTDPFKLLTPSCFAKTNSNVKAIATIIYIVLYSFT
jgi:hypothetical protein